jgi:predicted GH43/DUF377 family glycosyl hydrolase
MKLTVLSILALTLIGFNVHQALQFKKIKKEIGPGFYERIRNQVSPMVEKTLLSVLPSTNIKPLGGTCAPVELRNIPYADETGVLLDVKTISIRGVTAPYNASIAENENGYSLFFRYDILDYKCPRPFFSYIGAVELDPQFNQTEKEFVTLDTGSDFSEDPRILKTDRGLFLLYNDMLSPGETDKRIQRMASLDAKNYKANYINSLDLHFQFVEKNWTPFEHDSEIHIEYYLTPRKIMKMVDPKRGELIHLTSPTHPGLDKFRWPDSVWGAPRGGTPSIKIDDQYVGFFHTSFRDASGIIWYLMGAYTFDAAPPFAIRGLSQYPILFNGIFETPPMNTANPMVRCIFPCGLVAGKKEGKEVLYVSCGENDSNVKILTFDKEALLKSLRKIN